MKISSKNPLEESNPYLFFANFPFCKNNASSDSRTLITSHFIHQTISKIERIFCSEKYYGNRIDYFQNYEDYIISSLLSLLSATKESKSYDIISKESKKYPLNVLNLQDELTNFFSNYINKIISDLKRPPIEQSKFPGYYSPKSAQSDEISLKMILKKTPYQIEDLKKIYKILCKYPKVYSFSQEFVSSALNKLNNFLNNLCSLEIKDDDNLNQIHFDYFYNNTDFDDDKFNLYLIILFIKMRLFMMVNKIHDFLTIFLQLIVIEQKYPEMKFEFSYKQTIQQILPKSSTFRSIIIQNVSIDQIFDFFFDYDSKSYFFLTKEGIFKYNFNCKENENKYGFNSSYFTKINFNQEILENCNKNEVKITYSNGIIYLFFTETKSIHIISTEQEEDIKIDIPDFPVVSIGSFNDYFRIIQRKNNQNDNSILLLTNVILNSDNRNESSISEIEINDKNNNIKDILLANEYMFVCFENSTLEQFSLLKNGKVEKCNKIILPFILTNFSIKIDNGLFLHNIESVDFDGQFGVAFSSMYLPETKHWIRSENSFFIKYPFLHNLSTIVDNCSQFILNRKAVKDEQNIKFELNVLPNEMGSLYQELVTIEPQLECIKKLVCELKDDDLKRFFIVLFIKLNTINLIYKIYLLSYTEKIDKKTMSIMLSFKKFVLELYSMFPHSDCINFEIMIQETVVYTLLICGKFLFLPDSFDELREIFNNKLFNNEKNIYSNHLIKSFSDLLFSYPSSIYIIDKPLYNKLSEIDNIYELFTKNVRFLITESSYLYHTINCESIELIYPYVDILFEYINSIINDESFPITKVEMLLSYLFGIDLSNPYFSLKIEEKLIQICNSFYKRIQKVQEVIETDKCFIECNNDFEKNISWQPNIHLNFYNYLVAFLTRSFYSAYKSTKIEDVEDEFKLILDEKMIQGIKIEEIENYEQNIKIDSSQKSNTSIIRTITRGKSRGLDYDQEFGDDMNNSTYDVETKKSFLNGIIFADENPNSEQSKFLKFIYNKTANQTQINRFPKEFQIIEYYYIACILKQLGLTSISIQISKELKYKKDDTKLPSCLISLWKNVYSLRKELYFDYQKTKCRPNNQINSNDFENYLKEIKIKCKILIYSDPVLKLKKGETEQTLSTIYRFIKSKMPYSNCSELITIRRKRLDISNRSISLILSFINSNILFESSKLIFANFFNYNVNEKTYTKLNCQGLKQNELEKYDNLYSSLCLNIFKNIFTQPSIGMISSTSFLADILFNHENDDVRFQCSKIIIEMIEKTKESLLSNRIYFTLTFILLCIALKTKNEETINYIVSLLKVEKIDLESKQLILLIITFFTQEKSSDTIVSDKKFADSILDESFKTPIIAKSTFYWLAHIFNSHQSIDNNKQDFILKVFKGIGRSFTGQSCLFIDESFQPFAHRQVSEGMISFIRILYNFTEVNIINVIHYILEKIVGKIKIDNEDYKDNDEICISIGLFASLGQSLSSIENDRRITKSIHQDKSNDLAFENIIKYDENNSLYLDEFDVDCAYVNPVLIVNPYFAFSQDEIENILKLHESIFNSKYFKNEQKYDVEITQKEIIENVLISTFYSFLPIFMQCFENAESMLDEKNIERTLSIFELSKCLSPSNENSIIILSHYIEQAIFSSLYNQTNFDDSIKFIRLNFGEIIYMDNDMIKSDKDKLNLFIGNRPIDSNSQTFYELKIRKIGSRKFFIGFIDLEESSYDQAFGFEFTNNLCRKSPYFKHEFSFDELQIEENDRIGCFCTPSYCYLTLNGKLTPYRIFHKSLKSYSPVIYIKNDEIELEIVQNPTFIIDSSNDKYDLLNTINKNDEFFEEKDVKLISSENTKEQQEQQEKDTHLFIGGLVFINRIVFDEPELKTCDEYYQTLFKYRCRIGVIKDIYHMKDHSSICKLKIESYNNLTQSKEMIQIDVDSRNVYPVLTNFFNIIENCMNTKFGLNRSMMCQHYLKNKTIKDNSKSIAIIMTRYLVFIFIDYLRYVSSELLEDDEIDSDTSKKIIEALAFSLPSITLFQPSFDSTMNDIDLNYLIFSDDFSIYKIPGLASCFSLSFKAFLKESESFISPKFLSNLLQKLYEISSIKDEINCSSVYESIPMKYKIESFCPLQKEMNIKKEFLINEKNIGFIPILLNSIPDQLPSLIVNKKRLRLSSNQVSYFGFLNENKNISISWNFDLEKLKEMKINKNKSYDLKELQNYVLNCGLFLFSNYLNEELLNGSFGFIQIVFIVIQHMINSKFLDEKYKEILDKNILSNIFSLSLKKNVLAYPFLKPIVSAIASIENFTDTFMNEKSYHILSGSSNSLYQMEEFPTYENESPLIFNLYSILVQEEANHQKMNDPSILFENIISINSKLFNNYDTGDEEEDDYEEGNIVQTKNIEKDFKEFFKMKKAKNFRLLYLLYFYSILLKNENNFPYPMFLFYHDRMKQIFGEFQKSITFNDIKQYRESKKNCNDNKIRYESETIHSEKSLYCSFKIIKMSIPITTKKVQVSTKSMANYNGCFSDDESRIFVHQIIDNKLIEIPSEGEGVLVSFPLTIRIIKNCKVEIQSGDSFLVSFHALKEHHKNYFVAHFDEIQKEFKHFMEIKEYDNVLSKIILKSNELIQDKKDKNSSPHSFGNKNSNSTKVDFGQYSSPISSPRSKNTKNTKTFSLQDPNKKKTNNCMVNTNFNSNKTKPEKFMINTNFNSDKIKPNKFMANTNSDSNNKPSERIERKEKFKPNFNLKSEFKKPPIKSDDSENTTAATKPKLSNNETGTNSTKTKTPPKFNFLDYNLNFKKNSNDKKFNSNSKPTNEPTKSDADFTDSIPSANSNEKKEPQQNSSKTSSSTSTFNSFSFSPRKNTAQTTTQIKQNTTQTTTSNPIGLNTIASTPLISQKTQQPPKISTSSTSNSIVSKFGKQYFSTTTTSTRRNTTLSSLSSTPKINRINYQTYEIQKIPEMISGEIPSTLPNDPIVSLRYSILASYSSLVEYVIAIFSANEDESEKKKQQQIWWNFPLPSKKQLQNIFMRQIIQPALSMNTESKFDLINQMFLCEKKEKPSRSISFNRYEQQNFINDVNLKKPTKNRPLFLQFMEQVDISSLPILIVHKGNPFKAILGAEGAFDSGGPGREIFSLLMTELMNKYDCVFTFNPNSKSDSCDLNKEDLIPNKYYKKEMLFVENAAKHSDLFEKRFIYVGALIGICIVSEIPQPIKLSMMIWEYLSREYVSIESIYEIDKEFQIIIEHAESLAQQKNQDDDWFFERSFEIFDSYGKTVELVPSGSTKKITRENLNDYINKAKEFRIHEFDQELKDLKTGFEIILKNKNITKILEPKELKLLVCGEPDCSVDQMKKLTKIEFVDNNLSKKEKDEIVKMFWDLMNNFSVEQRMSFIRFSSGRIALPAPGLRWPTDLSIKFLEKPKNGVVQLIKAFTCTPEVRIPYFSNQEELKKILITCINGNGEISDSPINIEIISEYLS